MFTRIGSCAFTTVFLLLVSGICLASWGGETSRTQESKTPSSPDCTGFIGCYGGHGVDGNSALVVSLLRAESHGACTGWASPTGGGDQVENTQTIIYSASDPEGDGWAAVATSVEYKASGEAHAEATNGATIQGVWTAKAQSVSVTVDGTTYSEDLLGTGINCPGVSGWVSAPSSPTQPDDHWVYGPAPSYYTQVYSRIWPVAPDDELEMVVTTLCATSWQGTSSGPGPLAPHFSFDGDFKLECLCKAFSE